MIKRMLKYKTVKRLVLLVVVIAVLLSLFMVYIILPLPDEEKLDRKKIRIIYQVDHPTLLDDCRDIIRKANQGIVSEGFYLIKNNEQLDFPESILSIEPFRVSVNKDYILITIHRRFGHFGVTAFASDDRNPSFVRADKELIKGLWYFDDGYHKLENYDEVIEALRPVE